MSGMPGRLSFVSCRTPSECRVNEICLKKVGRGMKQFHYIIKPEGLEFFRESFNFQGFCIFQGESCRGYSNATKALCHRGSNFCGKIFFKGGSGLIRCIGDGIDQIRGFTDESNDLRLSKDFRATRVYYQTAQLHLHKLAIYHQSQEWDSIDWSRPKQLFCPSKVEKTTPWWKEMRRAWPWNWAFTTFSSQFNGPQN